RKIARSPEPTILCSPIFDDSRSLVGTLAVLRAVFSTGSTSLAARQRLTWNQLDRTEPPRGPLPRGAASPPIKDSHFGFEKEGVSIGRRASLPMAFVSLS